MIKKQHEEDKYREEQWAKQEKEDENQKESEKKNDVADLFEKSNPTRLVDVHRTIKKWLFITRITRFFGKKFPRNYFKY